MLEVRLKLSRLNLTIFGLYDPEEGREEGSNEFYKQLQDIYNKLNKNDHVILVGDLNARVGNKSINKNIGTLEKKRLIKMA
jgi:exonuclease III